MLIRPEIVAEVVANFAPCTLADGERIVAWMERKHATQPITNPRGMLESLLRKQQAEAVQAERFPLATKPEQPADRAFWGFDSSGATIRSAAPVANAQTQFARWLVREMRDQLLTPADVIALVSRQDDAIHRAVGIETLTHWTTHQHYDSEGRPCDAHCSLNCWARLTATSGLSEFVRSWGGWHPWLRDENAWAVMLERDAARRPAA